MPYTTYNKKNYKDKISKSIISVLVVTLIISIGTKLYFLGTTVAPIKSNNSLFNKNLIDQIKIWLGVLGCP